MKANISVINFVRQTKSCADWRSTPSFFFYSPSNELAVWKPYNWLAASSRQMECREQEMCIYRLSLFLSTHPTLYKRTKKYAELMSTDKKQVRFVEIMQKNIQNKKRSCTRFLSRIFCAIACKVSRKSFFSFFFKFHFFVDCSIFLPVGKYSLLRKRRCWNSANNFAQ